MSNLAPPPLALPTTPPPFPLHIPSSPNDLAESNCRRCDLTEEEKLRDGEQLLDALDDSLDDGANPPPVGEAQPPSLSGDEPAPVSEQDVAMEGDEHAIISAVDDNHIDKLKACTNKCHFDKGFHSTGNPVKPLKNIKNQPIYQSILNGQRCASGANCWDDGELFIKHRTALSSLVRGNVRLGDGSAHLGQSFPVSWTSSVSRQAKQIPSVLNCHCVTATTKPQHLLYLNHKKHGSQPLMIIIGDQYVPPVLGGNYRCAIILRMDSPSPATILQGVRTLFAGIRLPSNSIVFLSFTSLAIELRSSAFTRIALDLEEEIGRFFLQNRDPVIKETLLKQWRQDARAPMIVTLLSPHATASDAVSGDLAAASHVLRECYALRADTRLKDLASFSSSFHSNEGVKRFKTRVEAAAVVLPDIDSGIICTKPSKNVTAYGGYNKEDLPAVATKFWWQVAAETNQSWMDAGLDASAIPDMADCISGFIRNQVTRLGLKQSMPRLFKDLVTLDYGDSRPLPERIQRSLHPSQAEVGTVSSSTNRTRYKDVDVVLVGNSTAAALADKLKKLGLKTAFRPINETAGRLTHKSADLFSLDEMSGLNCLVVVDAFCNSLLQPEDCADSWLLDSEEKLQVLQTANASGHKVFHKVLADGRKLKPINDDSLVALINAVGKFCSDLVAAAGSDLRVVVLGPLPRYPHHCCESLDHKIEDGDAMATAKQIRDINYFISRSAMLPHMWSNAEDGVLVVPFHQWASLTFDRPYNANGIVSPDNVHVTKKCLDNLAAFLKSISTKNFRSMGLLPDAILHQKSPSEWLQGLLELGTPLPDTEINEPLTDEAAHHRGEKRKASCSAGRPPRAKGDLRDTFFHGRQSQTDSRPGHTPAQDRIRSASRGHPHHHQQEHRHSLQQRQHSGPSPVPRSAGSSRHHVSDRDGSRSQIHASRGAQHANHHQRHQHQHPPHRHNGGNRSGHNSGRHHHRDGRDKRR